MEDYKMVTLDTVADGVLPPLFAEELKKILNDIDDPKKDIKKKRVMKIKVEFIPVPGEDEVMAVAQVESVLAPTRPQVKKLYTGIDKKTGDPVAYEQNIHQQDLPFNKDDGPEIEEVPSIAPGGGDA